MSWCYRQFIRPLLFAQDPEVIHDWTLTMLAFLSRSSLLCEATQSFYGSERLPVRLWGLDFPNPVGLAAGLDKHAEAVPAWAALGFGHSELGAVTRHAQPGNPRPRAFRAVSEQALINRMGFNNHGAAAAAKQLQFWHESGLWPSHPVGINLGKSKITPLNEAPQDYAETFRLLRPWADFFVVNVSSPNTPGLRELQDKSALDEILAALQEINLPCPGGTAPKPILIKVAPDLTWEALDDILTLLSPRQVAGLIATNTTVERPTPSHAQAQTVYKEAGGLSGRPLKNRSTEIIRHLYKETKGETPIIGVGGVFNAADAWEKILAGASMIQIYTGLVYEGPALVHGIVSGLQQHLLQAGFRSLQDAVGKG